MTSLGRAYFEVGTESLQCTDFVFIHERESGAHTQLSISISPWTVLASLTGANDSILKQRMRSIFRDIPGW